MKKEGPKEFGHAVLDRREENEQIGKRLVIALMASSMLATPVYAAPNTDEIKAEKEQKEKEVESVQAQLQTMVSKILRQKKSWSAKERKSRRRKKISPQLRKTAAAV